MVLGPIALVLKSKLFRDMTQLGGHVFRLHFRLISRNQYGILRIGDNLSHGRSRPQLGKRSIEPLGRLDDLALLHLRSFAHMRLLCGFSVGLRGYRLRLRGFSVGLRGYRLGLRGFLRLINFLERF